MPMCDWSSDVCSSDLWFDLPNCSGHPFIEESIPCPDFRAPNPKAWLEGTAGWKKRLACSGASDEGNPQNQSAESCPVAAINPDAASTFQQREPLVLHPSLFSLQTPSLSVLYKDILSSQHSCWLIKRELNRKQGKHIITEGQSCSSKFSF